MLWKTLKKAIQTQIYHEIQFCTVSQFPEKNCKEIIDLLFPIKNFEKVAGLQQAKN